MVVAVGRASLGGNLCNSSPSADSIPTQIVLEAEVHIAGPKGWRAVPVENFCTAPGRNVLEKGEFVVALKFPPPEPRSGARFLRFIPRNEMDIAVVNTASHLKFDGDVVKWARVSLGAVAPTPLLVDGAAQALVGKPLTDATIEAAARRELLEESGYEADELEFLLRGPASPGSSTEVVWFYLARSVRKVHDGGGVEHERIRVHPVKLDEADAWLAAKTGSGVLVDPRVYLGVHYARQRWEQA